MAEREIKVTYKKSRRKRLYKFWDTVYVYEAMQQAVVIRANLQELSKSIDSEELPLVSIPGNILYQLVDSNIEAYERLLKERLIKTANISEIQPTLH